jgi:hypothetical protein
VEFWDSGPGADSGHFSVNGTVQTAGHAIAVSAADLANTTFVGGLRNGPETVWVRVYDGFDWGEWTSWQMSTIGNAPSATTNNNSIGRNQSVLASTLFSVSDADGDAITQYQFWDESVGASTGRFTLNGVDQVENAAITVAAADLGQLGYRGGNGTGSETLWVRANDGSGWSRWSSWQMSTLAA